MIQKNRQLAMRSDTSVQAITHCDSAHLRPMAASFARNFDRAFKA
jgi:hypothetical protein